MTQSNQPYSFTDFSGYAIPNTTQIPDEFLDFHMAFLSGAEVKVMLYIFRRTLGFKRYADNISLNQLLTGIVKRDGHRLDYGTGLSKSTLLAAIKTLVEKKLIIVEQRQSDARGNEPTTYKLNLSGTLGIKNDLGVSENNTPLGIKNDLGVGRKLDQALVLKIDPTINSNTTNSETRNSYNNNRDPEPTANAVVVALLVDRGVGKGVAAQLATNFPEDLVREKIEYLDFLLDQRPSDIQKPAAWLRKAIEDDYGQPDGFVSQAEYERQLAEEERQNRAAEEAREQELKRREAAAKARAEEQAAARLQLRKQHNTEPELEAQWTTILEEIRISGDASLYSLVANSQALSLDDDTISVAVDSPFHAVQLSRPLTQKKLKRYVATVLKQEYELRVTVVEAIA